MKMVRVFIENERPPTVLILEKKKKRILVVFVMPKKMLVNVFCYDISHKSQVVFFSAVYSVYTFIGAEHRVLCVLCTHPIVT